MKFSCKSLFEDAMCAGSVLESYRSSCSILNHGCFASIQGVVDATPFIDVCILGVGLH